MSNETIPYASPEFNEVEGLEVLCWKSNASPEQMGLSKDFIDQLLLVSSLAHSAVLEGGVGSLEPEGINISYGLLERPELRASLPWLEEWYMEEAPTLVSSVVGEEVVPTDLAIVDRGIVINVIPDRYDLHKDTNSFTLDICIQEPSNGGGELRMHPEGKPAIALALKRGTTAIFAGGELAHEVDQVNEQGIDGKPRITIIFSFHRPERIKCQPWKCSTRLVKKYRKTLTA